MFRLEDRQLHILTGLLFASSILLFLVFGIGKMPQKEIQGEIKGMTDFSEAWVCTYKTEDEAKLRANPAETESEEKGRTITEVVNFPAEFPVMEDETLILSHKVPDLDMETMYLTMQTKKQAVRVYAGEDILYESTKSDEPLVSFHFIPIPRDYKNMVITIELAGEQGKALKVNPIQAGTYNELLVQAFSENGSLFITGLLLICISICMLFVWFLAKNTSRQKKLLLYGSIEGILAGALFLMESRLVQLAINWNYGIYFAKACLLVIMAVFHLMIIRLFVYKKKILFFVDIGVLSYGIFYVSVMVLQAFSLIRFDGIYLTEKILFVISTLLYTILLFAAMSGHERKDGKLVFSVNIILLLCILMPFLVRIFGRQNRAGNIYICIGFLIYFIFVCIYGVKQAISIRKETKELPDNEEAVRTEVLEQINPNLLFASFQTLQNLIKNGSANSVKMIYYISVYFRGNLKALEQKNEVIPFEEELEHMISYLQLQKTRNQNLSFVMECKVKDFVVVRHSLEPMVENAVKYGIAGNDNKGNVVIRTYERQEGYAIQIIDDGIGFDKNVLNRKSPTALLNLFTILEKICGAKTEIISRKGKGTVITLILPMLENDLIKKD